MKKQVEPPKQVKFNANKNKVHNYNPTGQAKVPAHSRKKGP